MRRDKGAWCDGCSRACAHPRVCGTWHAHVAHSPPCHTCMHRYDYWDEDRSGSLEQEEVVRALLNTLQLTTDQERVAEMRSTVAAIWPIFDADGSGSIDRAEFLAPGDGACRHNRRANGPARRLKWTGETFESGRGAVAVVLFAYWSAYCTAMTYISSIRRLLRKSATV